MTTQPIPAQTQPTAVIYLRVSTKEQAERGGDGEGFSIPAQRNACTKKAESFGAVVLEEFLDAGESARSANRPELQAMLRYIAEHKPTYVVVHKVDRLARNRADDVEINLAITQAGATLVSCSENIDETPSGMLLHGIMSSIAEFYSQNLASEVKKGSLQKAMSGGTVGKAPTGYLNVRKIQNGREIRTVDIDPVRGPIMKWVFERYTNGDINIRDLLTEATSRGLNTVPGPRTVSKPLVVSNFHRLLKHPYYKGIVRYKGVLYPGQHEALVTEQTWDKVQEILASKGKSCEKQRKHRHYLKGTVYCGECESRLIVSHNKGRRGKIYPYFICIGRQQKRTNCTKKAVLIKTVEELVEQHYQTVQPTKPLLEKIRALILAEIQLQKAAADQENTQQQKRKTQLLNERAKLLEAHYAEAIELDQLKTEQQRIKTALKAADQRLQATSQHFEEIETNLNKALQYASSWEKAYRKAGSTIRRQMNQAIFKKIYVDDNLYITSEFNQLFELLLNKELTTVAEEYAQRTQQDPSYLDRELEALYNEWRNEQNNKKTDRKTKTPALTAGGLNYDHLVGVEGLEPPTPSV